MGNPIYLSQAQIDQIKSSYQAGLNAQGNYSHIYKLIGDMLPPSDVKNWFGGAEQANAGNGAYSAMIRGYSKRQMDLRGIGASYTDALMQAASNRVAKKAIEDILDLDGDPLIRKQPNGSWLFPTVDEIASRDAIGVGEILFDPFLLAGDTARSDVTTNGFNAGWAGAALFSPLDSAQTWRLTQGGGVGLNSLDDFKNVLFAYDALRVGISDAFGFTGFGQLFTDIWIGGNTVWQGGIAEAKAIAMQKLTSLFPPSAQGLRKLIEQVGVNAVLDMLISTSRAKPLHGTTTDANFGANALAYFPLTPTVIQGLKAELMPTNAGAMVALAKTDVNARAALAALSSVSVQINAATAANLDLYNPAIGIGELTDLYLNDRAKMLAWKMQYDSGALDSDDALFPYTPGKVKPYTEEWDAWKVSGDWDFIDRSLLIGGLPFTLAIDGLDPLKVTANHKIVFGSANPESLIGDVLVDHLYGGAGADTLTGNKGNDYLEGGSGFDTYIFNAGDGFDTVLDIDGSGVIQFGTIAATGSTGVLTTKWKQLGTDTWNDTQNGITYTRSVVGTETQLLIHKGDSNILVKGWGAGELGITLGASTLPVLPIVLSGTALPDVMNSLLYAFDDRVVRGQERLASLSRGGAGGDLMRGGDIATAFVFGSDSFPSNSDSLTFDDTLEGEAGDDWLQGGKGDDRLDGGADNDLMHGGNGSDILEGGTGDDVLWGLGANKYRLASRVIAGGMSNLPLASWLSDNNSQIVWRDIGSTTRITNITLHLASDGSLGFGYYISHGVARSAAATYATGTYINGSEVIYSYTYTYTPPVDPAQSSGRVTYTDASGSLTLELYSSAYLNGAPDEYVWNPTTNRFEQDTPASIFADTASDYLYGGAGDDLLIGAKGEDVLDGGADADLLQGNEGNDILLGGGGNHTLLGGAGQDILSGGAGIDTLMGGADNDTYWGVTGDDTILDTEGDNTIVLASANGLGAGGLSVINTGAQGQGRQLNIALDNGETLKLDDAFFGTSATLQFANGDATDLETLVGESLTTPLNLVNDVTGGKLYGGAGADVLSGGAGSDTLLGGNGNDTLVGEGGNDTLDGGTGDDDVQGGLGNDTVLGGAGNDRLFGYKAFSPDDAGNDVLYGGAGTDRMFGGQGNDTYLFGRGDGFDSIGEAPNANGLPSTDVLRLSAGVLPGHVSLHRVGDNLWVVIDASTTQIQLNNYFSTQDYQIERIEFDGGLGAVWTATDIAARVQVGTQNNMTGTPANDTFIRDHDLDVITESQNAGTDTVISSRSYLLPDNVENLTLTGFLNINAAGNGLDNILRGNSADNYISGGPSNSDNDKDTAYGGDGDDTYTNVKTIVENVGEGIDTWVSRFGGTLPDNVENLSMDDGSSSTAYSYSGPRARANGNDLDNILTSAGEGFQGEILDGGLGADTMIAQGWDSIVFYVDNVGDKVLASPSGGSKDEVRSTISYVLPSLVENLALLGSSTISGTGNDLNNVLDGYQNTEANILTGGAGNDFYVIRPNDRVVEIAGEGSDRAHIWLDDRDSGTTILIGDIGSNSIESFAVSGYAQNVTLRGDAGDNTLIAEMYYNYYGTYGSVILSGENGNDRLSGGYGNDVLNGGGGADHMSGNAGNDLYLVDDEPIRIFV